MAWFSSLVAALIAAARSNSTESRREEERGRDGQREATASGEAHEMARCHGGQPRHSSLAPIVISLAPDEIRRLSGLADQSTSTRSCPSLRLPLAARRWCPFFACVCLRPPLGLNASSLVVSDGRLRCWRSTSPATRQSPEAPHRHQAHSPTGGRGRRSARRSPVRWVVGASARASGQIA